MTVIYVGIDRKAAGLIAIADPRLSSSHSDADIGRRQSGRVVDPVARHYHDTDLPRATAAPLPF